jgi:DNA primase
MASQNRAVMQKPLKDLVLESSDIVEVIGERLALTRKGKDYLGLCPFHDDHKPSMAVSPAKQIFKCWSCGAGGDVIKFIQMRDRVDFREALASLARRAGIELSNPAGDDGRASAARDELRRVVAWARAYFRRNLTESTGGQAAAYAESRGFSSESLERLGIGFALDAWDHLLNAGQRAGIPREALLAAGLLASNDSGRVYDRFRNRLIFPIHDGQGRPIAFGGRTLGDDPAKYLNSPETPLFSKSRVLYGLDLARVDIAAAKETIVVEGYVDALMMHQAGIPNTVATLGTALTDQHVRLLAPLCSRVVMCFDGDEAGLRAADRAVEVALKHRLDVRVAVMPENLDPADVVIKHGADVLKSLLQSAIGALEFKWNRTAASFSGATAGSKRDAVEAFVGFVGRVTQAGGIDPLDQGLLVGRLSELMGVPTGVIYDLLSRVRIVRPATPDNSNIDNAEASYDASVRGLPPGLISGAEAMFGVTMLAGLTQRCDESLSLVAGFCRPWQRLLERLREVADAGMAVSRESVLSEEMDAELCDLVSRACSHVSAGQELEEAGEEIRLRLVAELEALRMGRLKEGLRTASPEDRERSFRSLLDVARRRHGVLSVEQGIASA